MSVRFVDSGTLQREIPMKTVYMARAHEWREDCLPLAIPCTLWEEVKHVKGPDLKFLFNDLTAVSFVSYYRSLIYFDFVCLLQYTQSKNR